MAVAGRALIRLIRARGRAGALEADAGCGKLGNRGQRRGDGGRATAGAEASAGRIGVMRPAAVMRALTATGLLLHPVAVRAVLGARQRRGLDENDAEPEGPEAGEQSQADGTTHGDRIHRVMAKRIPTALGEGYRRWEESSSDPKGSQAARRLPQHPDSLSVVWALG